jgi:hypothetical protein
MASEETSIIGESQDLGPNGLHELMEIATHQVSPSNGSQKDHIPYQSHFLNRKVEDHMPRCMPRRMPNVEVRSPESQDVPMRHGTVRSRQFTNERKVEGPGLRINASIEALVIGMEINGDHRIQIPKRRNPLHMIEMRVGEEDGFEREPLLLDELNHRGGCGPGIDGHALVGLLELDQVAVLTKIAT